jgi:hypothetical protein
MQLKQTTPQSHLRQTASSFHKQVRRISRFPEKEKGEYFTISPQGKTVVTATAPVSVKAIDSN